VMPSVTSEDEQSSKKGSTVRSGSGASEDEESSKNVDAMEDVMQPVSHHQPIPRKAKQSVCYKEASKNKAECGNDSSGSSFIAPEDDMNSNESARSKARKISKLPLGGINLPDIPPLFMTMWLSVVACLLKCKLVLPLCQML